MKVGILHERAVRLNPRAARIAAELLARDPELPPKLRQALTMALAKIEPAPGKACGSGSARDTRAATSFATACHEVCLHLGNRRAGHGRATTT